MLLTIANSKRVVLTVQYTLVELKRFSVFSLFRHPIV